MASSAAGSSDACSRSRASRSGSASRSSIRASDCPSAGLGELFVAAYDDEAALAKLAAKCEVVTYEFESVPVAAVHALEARGARVYPPAKALAVAQDCFEEKSFFQLLGIPTADFAAVASEAELAGAVAALGTPCVLKTRRFGYDGKGQFVVKDASQIAEAWSAVGAVPCIVERFVPFDCELSIVTVRGGRGEAATYALVENHHAGGILRVSYAPARRVDAALQAKAASYAEAIRARARLRGRARRRALRGVRRSRRGRELVANEMAPRVHNSGHWTIEGAETSQFENHVRAVLGSPLGKTTCRGASAPW